MNGGQFAQTNGEAQARFPFLSFNLLQYLHFFVPALALLKSLRVGCDINLVGYCPDISSKSEMIKKAGSKYNVVIVTFYCSSATDDYF